MPRDGHSDFHVDTMSTQSDGDADRGSFRFPCLTLAYHADWSRIGERAFIGHVIARPIRISRTEPSFSRRGSTARSALTDPYVSRDPITLTWNGANGVTVSAAPEYKRLVINGEPVSAEWQGSADDIANGVVIELGKRVVLVLHMATKRDAPPALDMVGDSDAIDDIRIAILRVADLPVSVLIRGETGVGKEHVAQALHNASPRKDKPWVAINMAAVPPTTAASELFGHAKGAFTGANTAHDGMFVRADGGTLFLDEVGETPDSVQPMLLRTLETGEVQPVGQKRSQVVDTRVVAATDADLEAAQNARQFRPALFHRLSGYQISVPPLRNRREDIGPLLAHFFRDELEATGEQDALRSDPKSKPWLPIALASRLVRFSWPGNVRQLRNVVRQIAISSRGEQHARTDHALEQILANGGGASATVAPADSTPAAADSDTPSSDKRNPEDVSEAELLEALRANDWAIRPTAVALGVPRSSLYGLMRKSPSIRAATDIGDDEIRSVHKKCDGDLTKMARELCVSKRGLTLRLRTVDIED